MNLFSKLRSGEMTFDAPKAVMTIVVAAIKSDGNLSDEEIGGLRGMCARSPIFARNSREEDDAIIGFADRATRQLGEEAVSRAALSLDDPLRETAFAFACDMVFSDGVVGDAEESFITNLAATLRIPTSLAEAIIDVTMIRMRGLS